MNYSKKSPEEREATGRDRRTKKDEDKQLFTLEVVNKKPPSYLPPLAKRYWKDNIDLLCQSNLVKATDLAVFELLCKTYSDYRYLSARVEELRKIATWSLDEETKITNLASRSAKQYTDLASKLGMTAVDRSRVVNTSSSTDSDEFSEYEKDE